MKTLNKPGWIGRGIFLFLVITNLMTWPAFAKTVETSEQEVTMVEGFRSAQFGMTEAEVIAAINKDFNLFESDIRHHQNSTEKTNGLSITIQDILPATGKAMVTYIFGYKTKKLIQVNILWGKPAETNPDPEKLVAAANSLRSYFARQGFQKDDLMMNARLKDGSVLVFRGTDRNGRIVLLLLHNPQNPKEEDQEAEAATIENLSLRLFYISDPISPDIFQIKSGDF